MTKPMTLAAASATTALLALSTLGVPSAADARASQESFSLRGVIADAGWYSESEEPEAGEPMAVSVMGSSAVEGHHVAGSRPVRTRLPSVVAMAFGSSPDGPGEPDIVELWAVAPDATFTAGRRLGSATLHFEAEAEYYRFDPETGEEVSTGETVPVTVHARWTASGPVSTDHLRNRYTQGTMWTIEHGRSTWRPAEAELTVTGPDGTLFDGPMTDAQISRVRGATLRHRWDLPDGLMR